MEKFNSCSTSTEQSGSNQPLKVPEQLTSKRLQKRKLAPKNSANQGNATSSSRPSTSHKPDHPKPPLEEKPSTNDHPDYIKPTYLKPVADMFGVQLQSTNKRNDGNAAYTKPHMKTSDLAKEDPESLHPKPAVSKFLKSDSFEKEKHPLGTKPNSNFAPQESEANPAVSRVARVKEIFMSAVKENEPKPPFSKQPLGQKQSLEVSHNEAASNKTILLQKGLSGPRPNIHSFKSAKEIDENSKRAAETSGKHFSNIVLKPTSCCPSSFQGIPKNVKEKTGDKEMSTAKNIFLKKNIQEDSSSLKLHKMNTVLAAGRPSGGSQEDEDRSSGTFKRNSLIPLYKLGHAPEKPSRPPHVDLGTFLKDILKDSPPTECVKETAPSSVALFRPVRPPHCAKQLPPPPPVSHPSLQSMEAPILPPRKIKNTSETVLLKTKFFLQGQESDVEMYEDINDIRSKGKEKKGNKEKKRRLDQEKKEQKEKEKKEQEIRKKFKLTGPIQVLHQARACADHKGGKNELIFREGDEIEIIRLTDNPEGKWLGRIKGCYGYIKTTMVEIDYDSLRKKQPLTRAALRQLGSYQDVYDDVGDQKSMFPPPPSAEEMHDVFDDKGATTRSISQDEDKNDMWSWGILKKLKLKDLKKKSVREKPTTVNVAEDNGDLLKCIFTKIIRKIVNASDLLLILFLSVTSCFSLPKSASLEKHASNVKDTQQHKNIEREEEFRKMFKFEGEIKVLYSTTTVLDLNQRRWGYKDLKIKPGESLEIIENTDDTKVLCRNKDGK
ncbi:FYB1 protein, partial [Halcyon senegalensis]|nr:FYB1 protein [Halcyon senegalensis]